MSADLMALLQIAALMQRFERPSCIAGGWAIDLFLGRMTRPHKDIEIAIFCSVFVFRSESEKRIQLG
jgi:hypothetical protein